MKIFTIDIGNTRTHCATVETDGRNFTVLSSEDFLSSDFANVFDWALIKNNVDGIAWCSVVPKYSDLLRPKLAEMENIQLTFENSPIELDVEKPSQVGQDRIADAVGAGIFFDAPYIVVDMGTAVTIDLVDSSGRYAGGAIAPGMHAFTDYLNERAALLPKINPTDTDYDISVGKDTESAMRVGCVKGFCKLADGLIGDIEREFFGGESARGKTIFTGGSVAYLPKKWLAERRVEANLANLGLARSFLFNKGIL